MQPKTFDEHLQEARRRPDRPVHRMRPIGEDEWTADIALAEAAIAVLWQTVQTTRATNYRREQSLWRRHHEELWHIKRNLDAVVM